MNVFNFTANKMAYQASMQEESLRKGSWLEEEDERLITFVTLLGERRWDSIARAAGLKRSGKSCRLRWLNYLRPNIKHGNISEEEEQIILQLHQRWGNKWSSIARRLPGRTDNEIKNYWKTNLRKKAQLQEQLAKFQTGRNDAEQDLLFQTGVKKYNAEDLRPVEDILGTDQNTCNEFVGIENFSFTSSPYETRISDWIPDLSNDQSSHEVKHQEDCSSVESCLFNPGWISEDTDIWDCSASLWDMN